MRDAVQWWHSIRFLKHHSSQKRRSRGKLMHHLTHQIKTTTQRMRRTKYVWGCSFSKSRNAANLSLFYGPRNYWSASRTPSTTDTNRPTVESQLPQISVLIVCRNSFFNWNNYCDEKMMWVLHLWYYRYSECCNFYVPSCCNKLKVL